jgi:hypothetical protein
MSRKKEVEYMDKRIRVSVKGLAYTGTIEQAWEIYDFLEKVTNRPIIVQDFHAQLWIELKAMEGK